MMSLGAHQSAVHFTSRHDTCGDRTSRTSYWAKSLQHWEWLHRIDGCRNVYLEKRPAQRFLQHLIIGFFSQAIIIIFFGAVGLFAVSSIADKLLLSGYKIDPLKFFSITSGLLLIFGSLILFRRLSLSKT